MATLKGIKVGSYYKGSNNQYYIWSAVGGGQWMGHTKPTAPNGTQLKDSEIPAGAPAHPVQAAPASSPTASPASTGKTSVASGIGPDDDGDAVTIVIRNPTINASSFKAGNSYSGDPQSGTLRYPKDPGINATADYVLFEFFNYAPPFGRNSSRTADTLNYIQTSGYPGYSDYMQSQERSWASPSKIGPIMMYMPEDIGDQMGADWGGAGFGATAAGLMNVAGTKTDKFTLGGFAAAIPGVVKTGAFEAIRKGLNAATGSNISQNQLLGGVTGTVINPNVEMMYDAPKLRTWSLKFKMVARNNDESKEIRAICQRFKKALLPTYGGQALGGTLQASNLLTIPPLCQVTYMNGNNVHEYLPRYKLAALTDVDISYTPDGAYATYMGGAPVATEITINFAETKLIFEHEVQESGKAY